MHDRLHIPRISIDRYVHLGATGPVPMSSAFLHTQIILDRRDRRDEEVLPASWCNALRQSTGSRVGLWTRSSNADLEICCSVSSLANNDIQASTGFWECRLVGPRLLDELKSSLKLVLVANEEQSSFCIRISREFRSVRNSTAHDASIFRETTAITRVSFANV